MLIQCCMLVEKQFSLNLELNRKRKENLAKIKKANWKIDIENEIKTMRGEMSILSKIGKNKDPKTRKARKLIGKYKITNAIDIPNIKEELKQKIQVKARREDDLINVTNFTGKIKSSRRMPKNSIEK